MSPMTCVQSAHHTFPAFTCPDVILLNQLAGNALCIRVEAEIEAAW